MNRDGLFFCSGESGYLQVLSGPHGGVALFLQDGVNKRHGFVNIEGLLAYYRYPVGQFIFRINDKPRGLREIPQNGFYRGVLEIKLYPLIPRLILGIGSYHAALR